MPHAAGQWGPWCERLSRDAAAGGAMCAGGGAPFSGVTDTAHTQDTISKPIRNRLASLIEGSQRGRCEEDMERSARVISPQSFGYIIEQMMKFFSARAAATARCLS